MLINIHNPQELSANQNGEMRLRVESDQVTISTHFKELEIPEWSKFYFQVSNVLFPEQHTKKQLCSDVDLTDKQSQPILCFAICLSIYLFGRV